MHLAKPVLPFPQIGLCNGSVSLACHHFSLYCPEGRDMLAVFVILGGFVPLVHAALPLNLVTANNGLITNQLVDSVFLTLPPCNESGKLVNVEYLNTETNEIKVLPNAFAVPTCDGICCPSEPTAVSRRLGYQLEGLSSNTTYIIQYKIGSSYTEKATITTRAASDHNAIDTRLPGRSAAMVVITVLLCVAMFVLLIGLIVALLMPSNSG